MQFSCYRLSVKKVLSPIILHLYVEVYYLLFLHRGIQSLVIDNQLSVESGLDFNRF